VPRKIVADWKSLSPEEKKALMSMTRSIAFRLAAAGTCLMLQKGNIVTQASGHASLTQDSVRGPIRIRLAGAAAAGVGEETSTSCNDGGKDFITSESDTSSTRKKAKGSKKATWF